ncbi:Inducible T-cell costimulator, partial [Madurella mycetomatis]
LSLTAQIMYVVSAMWVKVTLLVLYLRIFRPSLRANIMIWLGIGICVLFYVICVVTALVNCLPINKSLPINDPTGSSACGQPQLNLALTQSVFSVITDFYVLTIPMSLVLGLHLPFGRKIGVSALFLTGLLACACSLGNAIFRWKQRSSPDYMWDSIPPYALAFAELNVGIICACLPVGFVLFKKFTAILLESVKQYLKSRRTRKRDARQGSSDYSAANDRVSGESLPKIPGAIMNSLRSFISRISGRTRNPKTITVVTELSMYNELVSIDVDYHAQLTRAIPHLEDRPGRSNHSVAVGSNKRGKV